MIFVISNKSVQLHLYAHMRVLCENYNKKTCNTGSHSGLSQFIIWGLMRVGWDGWLMQQRYFCRELAGRAFCDQVFAKIPRRLVMSSSASGMTINPAKTGVMRAQGNHHFAALGFARFCLQRFVIWYACGLSLFVSTNLCIIYTT